MSFSVPSCLRSLIDSATASERIFSARFFCSAMEAWRLTSTLASSASSSAESFLTASFAVSISGRVTPCLRSSWSTALRASASLALKSLRTFSAYWANSGMSPMRSVERMTSYR